MENISGYHQAADQEFEDFPDNTDEYNDRLPKKMDDWRLADIKYEDQASKGMSSCVEKKIQAIKKRERNRPFINMIGGGLYLRDELAEEDPLEDEDFLPPVLGPREDFPGQDYINRVLADTLQRRHR